MNGGDYAVRFRDGSGTVVSPVLPTPRLLDEGWRPIEAYEEKPASEKYPPVWRVRDDAYDPPGTEYVRVTVERIPYTWTCEFCGRTWTSLDQFGPEFDAFARHKD
jgi:hypothetical protein